MKHHLQVVISIEAESGEQAVEAMADILNYVKDSNNFEYVVEELDGELLPPEQQRRG